MKKRINNNITINSKLNNESYFNEIKYCLVHLSSYYSYFSDWLGKVFREVKVGKRTILLHYSNDIISGINILKHSRYQNKLCTIWIHPYYRFRGIATNLLLESKLKFSGNDPVITIPEFAITNFQLIIYRNKFYLYDRIPNLYKHGITEYIFKIPLK